MRRINLKKANVARAYTIRDINRQIVLNYVREKEPISRAEIASETALQRSTVSLIVDELKTQGLIYEIEGESTGGRPPALLRLQPAAFMAIGVDLGTAETTIAVGDLLGHIVDREVFPTDRDLTITFRKVVAGIQKFVRTYGNIEGIGVSIPGLVDSETEIVRFVPYFKWRNWPLAAELRKATGLSVAVDNDANAVGLAELWLGRPEVRDGRDFVLVLVEDGLGTGIIFDGQLYRGVAGGAGEFGHMTIGKGAPVACAAGSEECWEAFASERAALARYKERSGSDVTFHELIDNAFAGDIAAKQALVETAHYLGLGISNMTKGLSPEAVIVAGDIARAWPIISSELRRTLAANSICSDLPSTPVYASTLHAHTRVLGALSLVLARRFASVVPA